MSQGFKPKQRIIKKELIPALIEDVRDKWEDGWTAKDIIDSLDLEENNNPYKGISVGWIYQHKDELGLSPHMVIKNKHPHRYKILPEELGEKPTPNKFRERLDEIFPVIKNNSGVEYIGNKKYRALMWMYYNSPLRRQEILNLIYSDVEVDEENGILVLKTLVREKQDKKNPKNSPFYYDLKNDPGAEDILGYMVDGMKRYQDSSKKIFEGISGWMAWNTMKKLFPDFYIHFYRHSYVTVAAETDAPMIDILTEVSIDPNTLKHYLMKGKVQLDKAFERRREKKEKKGGETHGGY